MPEINAIELSHGELTFSARSMGAGPIVFCLHGFPDNLHTFDTQLPALAAAGYQAIAPAMRGYEPSSQPMNREYSADAIASDLFAWADQLGAEQFHLVGHDWGAIVAYVAAAMAPERLKSLTTMAIPHTASFAQGLKKVPSQSLKSWYTNFFQLPALPEYFAQRNEWALIRKLWRDWSPSFELTADDWNGLRSTFEAPGVLDASLSYYRQNVSLPKVLGWVKTPMNSLKSIPVPTLALTGEEDGCIDTRLFDYTMDAENFPKGIRVERLAGVGHFLQREDPERVNELLLDWIATHQ